MVFQIIIAESFHPPTPCGPDPERSCESCLENPVWVFLWFLSCGRLGPRDVTKQIAPPRFVHLRPQAQSKWPGVHSRRATLESTNRQVARQPHVDLWSFGHCGVSALQPHWPRRWCGRSASRSHRPCGCSIIGAKRSKGTVRLAIGCYSTLWSNRTGEDPRRSLIDRADRIS